MYRMPQGNEEEEMKKMIAGLVCLAVMLGLASTVRAEKLIGLDFNKSLGIAYTYSFDQNKSGAGLKFNPIKLFDGYVSAGLFAYDNSQLEDWPLLGGNISLDVAKMIKKDKGILSNFDVGYWFTWTSMENFLDQPFNPDIGGMLGTVFKFEF